MVKSKRHMVQRWLLPNYGHPLQLIRPWLEIQHVLDDVTYIIDRHMGPLTSHGFSSRLTDESLYLPYCRGFHRPPVRVYHVDLDDHGILVLPVYS